MFRLSLFLILFSCSLLSVFAQTNSCNLQLEIYKLKSDHSSEVLKLKNANISLRDLRTQKKIKAVMKNDVPYFPNLKQADYEAVVSMQGYKSTNKKISLDCGLANEQNLASEVVFFWEGNPKETVKMANFLMGVKVSVFPTQETKSLDIMNGKVTNLITPEYPPAARAVRAGGAVNVLVLIDELGRVVSAKAQDGHPLLRRSAETAAKQSRFTTTFLQNIPVKVSGIVVYNFTPQ